MWKAVSKSHDYQSPTWRVKSMSGTSGFIPPMAVLCHGRPQNGGVLNFFYLTLPWQLYQLGFGDYVRPLARLLFTWRDGGVIGDIPPHDLEPWPYLSPHVTQQTHNRRQGTPISGRALYSPVRGPQPARASPNRPPFALPRYAIIL